MNENFNIDRQDRWVMAAAVVLLLVAFAGVGSGIYVIGWLVCGC